MNSLVAQMRLTTQTPLHTTGDRGRWGADKALAVSADGTYVVPATSVKGVLRAAAERLLTGWGLDVCQGPAPQTMCRIPQQLCLICKVFGNPRNQSPIRFTDARISDSSVSPDGLAMVRSGVSISRHRGVSYPQRLFFLEVTPSEVTWLGDVKGDFSSRELASQAAALLVAAARSVTAVGGGCSRGLGRIRSWEIDATVDGDPVLPTDLAHFWSAWAGGREA